MTERSKTIEIPSIPAALNYMLKNKKRLEQPRLTHCNLIKGSDPLHSLKIMDISVIFHSIIKSALDAIFKAYNLEDTPLITVLSYRAAHLFARSQLEDSPQPIESLEQE